MEKPPVLSNQRLSELQCEEPDNESLAYERMIAEAQRDADVEWHEKEERELVDGFTDTMRDMVRQNRLDLEQARQETAREIDEFLQMHLYARPDQPNATMGFNDWMELKKLLAKYIK